MSSPLLVAIEMGYGHLRAAQPLAEFLGVPTHKADEGPLADSREARLWASARRWYELGCRVSELPLVGAPLRAVLQEITFIPHLHPYRDLSRPSGGSGLGGWARECSRDSAPRMRRCSPPSSLQR